MQTTETANLFQSDQQHARASFRAAKHALHAESGSPIQLSGKPLHVVIRQKYGKEAEAWCAESGFVVRHVGLESGKTKQIFRGHTGPVTSLDFYTIPASASTQAREILISGSWDRSFRLWDLKTKTHLSTTLAHTDFIKTLIVIPSLKLLVTGSSDKDIRLWDLTPLESRDLTALIAAPSSTLTVEDDLLEPLSISSPASLLAPIPIPTGAAPPIPKSRDPVPVLMTLKSHIRPPERFASYSIPLPSSPDQSENDDAILVDSGHIALISTDGLGQIKTWELWRDEEGHIRAELRSDFRPHENGVYDLVIGDGEIWTASVDNSVLLSTFDPCTPSIPPRPTLRIPHPFGVRSILSLPLALPSLNSSHLLTGSSDESIRVFDLNEFDASSRITTYTEPWIGLPAIPISTMDGKKSLPGLVKEIQGHSHDVTFLGTYMKVVEGKNEAWILSASIDGTLRRWPWPDVLREDKKTQEKIIVEVEEGRTSLLTEEEERELEELMRDD